MAAFVILRLTFLEALRRRILAAAIALGLLFLLIFAIGVYYIHGQAAIPDFGAQEVLRAAFYSFFAMAGLYAVDFLAIAMAALLSADTLAGEINSGTIQALVTKPVQRRDIVFGKWLGFASLLAVYTLFMAGGVLLIVFLTTGYLVPNPLTGVLLIYASSLLIMTLTLALSSTFSTLATGGIVFGLYGLGFIGGWLEQFGAFFKNQTAVNVGIISSLIIPSDALWRRASFEMTPSLTQSLGLGMGGPFLTLSTPSYAMVLYAGFYLLAALALAAFRFGRRDL